MGCGISTCCIILSAIMLAFAYYFNKKLKEIENKKPVYIEFSSNSNNNIITSNWNGVLDEPGSINVLFEPIIKNLDNPIKTDGTNMIVVTPGTYMININVGTGLSKNLTSTKTSVNTISFGMYINNKRIGHFFHAGFNSHLIDEDGIIETHFSLQSAFYSNIVKLKPNDIIRIVGGRFFGNNTNASIGNSHILFHRIGE